MQWVEVLNQATRWSDFDEASRQLRDRADWSAARHARVVSDAALLRRVYAAQVLEQPLGSEDRQELMQWLTAVTPEVQQARGASLQPTSFTARRQAAALPEPFESQLSSALLQLLATVSEPTLLRMVHRCQGILRQPSLRLLDAETESRFLQRAGLDSLLRGTEPDELSQCPQLIFSQRGRHFCSKACSNATFAARKALEDPHYFAAKQERYRARQRQAVTDEVEETEGAFVYMD